MPITLLDFILIAVMLVSAVLAMIRGFSREIFSIISWGVAAAAAFFFFPAVTPMVMNVAGDMIGNSQTVASIAAAAGIFLVVLIIVSYLTMLIADFIVDSRIGALDRTLGFIFGAARGALLVIVALMGFLWLANNNEPGWIANAKSKPMMVAIGTSLRDALPEDLEAMVSGALKGESGNEAGEQDSEQSN